MPCPLKPKCESYPRCKSFASNDQSASPTNAERLLIMDFVKPDARVGTSLVGVDLRTPSLGTDCRSAISAWHTG